MGPNPQFPEDLVTFTEEILNEILLFSCSVCIVALDLSFYMTYKKIPGLISIPYFCVNLWKFKVSKKSLSTTLHKLRLNQSVFWPPSFWMSYIYMAVRIQRGGSIFFLKWKHPEARFPVDTGRKLNIYKTFRIRSGRLLNVLCTFNLRPVSRGLTLRLTKIDV